MNLRSEITVRRYTPAFLLYVLTFFACIGLVAIPAGCGQSKRTKTIQATVVALDAARVGFTTWDRAHQLAIVDKATSHDDGDKALTDYLGKRVVIVAGFEVAYRAVAVAATQTDELSLTAALGAATELYDALKKLTGGL